MTMDSSFGSMPPVRHGSVIDTRWQGRGHVATDTAQDANCDRAQNTNGESDGERLLCVEPEDIEHGVGGEFNRPFWLQAHGRGSREVLWHRRLV